jgi:hypothetical protein
MKKKAIKGIGKSVKLINNVGRPNFENFKNNN